MLRKYAAKITENMLLIQLPGIELGILHQTHQRTPHYKRRFSIQVLREHPCPSSPIVGNLDSSLLSEYPGVSRVGSHFGIY